MDELTDSIRTTKNSAISTLIMYIDSKHNNYNIIHKKLDKMSKIPLGHSLPQQLVLQLAKGLQTLVFNLLEFFD